MIAEDYCSFKVAKLLKEKGFEGECDWYYPEYGGEMELLDLYELNYCRNNFIQCPTLQMACKWLREVHGLIINIEFQIICPTWKWRIYVKSSNDKHTNFQHYNKYEEAVEAALKYSLENLI